MFWLSVVAGVWISGAGMLARCTSASTPVHLGGLAVVSQVGQHWADPQILVLVIVTCAPPERRPGHDHDDGLAVRGRGWTLRGSGRPRCCPRWGSATARSRV